MPLHALRNPIREYAWGSRHVLAELLGQPAPSPQPQAELWMGSHARASSEIEVAGVWRSLADVIEEAPRQWLGDDVVSRFGGELPFLLKVLAVSRPLSLQTHPDANRARTGFERERAAGIPVDAPERSYPDPRGKPELVCALTPFRALCGFRAPAQQRRLCAVLALPALDELLAATPREPASAILAGLLRLEGRTAVALAGAAAERAGALAASDPAFADLAALAADHPADVAVLAPLLLEPVALRPGEALYLPPGELHAYLKGAAVELMASSDNVLRAGLTGKTIAVDELLAVVQPDARPPQPLLPETREPGERVYPTPCDAFRLSVLHLAPDAALERKTAGRPEILFCPRGTARIDAPGATPVHLQRGQAIFVSAHARSWRLRGDAEIYRASVPASPSS